MFPRTAHPKLSHFSVSFALASGVLWGLVLFLITLIAAARGIGVNLSRGPPWRLGIGGPSRQSNQLLIRTILPSTVPVARSSMASRAPRSGNVRFTSGSIFFSSRSAKIFGKSSRSGLGSFRYRAVMP